MKTFFSLVDDVHIADRWHLGEVLNGGNPLELWNGNPIKGEVRLKAIVDRPGRPLDFSLTSFAAPVVKGDLARAIASVSGTDLQRLPVLIDGHDEYEVLNSVRVVACLNENESEFTKWTEKDHRPEFAGQYRMVTKLKLDRKRIPPDAHFFRIEGWRIALIVSQAVRRAMETSGCLGAIFQDVT
jgi:hypothetical protein